ncbi:MAG: AAA family ATPase [Candidatus Omnitrophica bacterium]|nr:AAA family ATPase [Candidatus Omnitrophota bacterium]
MIYAVRERKLGFLLLGRYGLGKTFLSKALEKECSDSNYKFISISNPRLTPLELVKEISYQLGVVPVDQSWTKVDYLHKIKETLEKNYQGGFHTVIIIDEMQSIESNEVLEEIRLLFNLQKEVIFFTLILLAQLSFKENLEKFPHFKQRIPIKYELSPLDEGETKKYIEFRLKKAGAAKEIFSSKACKQIYTLSKGVPRLINNICDLALLAGYLDNLEVVKEDTIFQVAQDLGEIKND